MLRILHFKDKYKKMWDDYVKRSPAGTYYHLTGWKEVIEKTFRFKSIYLMAQSDNDEISGVLPLFLMKDILGKNYLISNPSANYTGVCASDKEAKYALLNKAEELARENKVQYLELRQLAESIYDLPTKKDYVTMFLRLDGNEEFVWKNSLNTKTRNQVRKAYKEGLTVDFGRKYLNSFYKVLSANFKDLGTPIYPKSFFENLVEEFGESANFIVVKHQNMVIGGMLIICYKNVFSDPWASSLKKYNGLCPNNILYWEAIKYACRNGFEYFDFGRSSINSGTFKFKKQWGAEPVQLHYQYSLTKMQNMPGVSSHKTQYQFAINVWKRLPLAVANALGPIFNRYLMEL